MAASIQISALGADDCSAVEALGRAAGLRLEAARQLENPNALCWVARGTDPPEAIGFLCAWRLGAELELIDLVVAPAWRRQGVGRALVETLRARARALGSERIFLEVRASNHAALGLYRSIGFSVVGSRPGYYKDGEDALQMVYPL